MLEGLEIFVTESREYILNELYKQGVSYEINESNGKVWVNGEVVLKDIVIEIAEVPLPACVFEGLDEC